MANIVLNVNAPVINLLKIDNESRCILVQHKTSEDTFALHFESKDDLDAYIGLLQVTRGQLE